MERRYMHCFLDLNIPTNRYRNVRNNIFIQWRVKSVWLRKSGRYAKKNHVNWNILLFKTHTIYETYKIISHHHRMSLKIIISIYNIHIHVYIYIDIVHTSTRTTTIIIIICMHRIKNIHISICFSL